MKKKKKEKKNGAGDRDNYSKLSNLLRAMTRANWVNTMGSALNPQCQGILVLALGLVWGSHQLWLSLGSFYSSVWTARLLNCKTLWSERNEVQGCRGSSPLGTVGFVPGEFADTLAGERGLVDSCLDSFWTLLPSHALRWLIFDFKQFTNQP